MTDLDLEGLVEAATARPQTSGCPVCRLEGKPAEAVKRLEQIAREKGNEAINKSAIARDPGWQESTGISVYPLRTHFRDHLDRDGS